MCDSGEADARVAGEFVRYHPAGKAQVVKMGAKMYIMQHLTSTVILPCPFLRVPRFDLALLFLSVPGLLPLACPHSHALSLACTRQAWRRGCHAWPRLLCCLTLCAQEPEVSKEALSCVQKLMVN